MCNDIKVVILIACEIEVLTTLNRVSICLFSVQVSPRAAVPLASRGLSVSGGFATTTV